MEREHGRIILVSTRSLGSTLTADVAAGATVLPVHDAGDFDPEGGSLSIGGAVATYSAVDDDASTVTLSSGLAAAALDGDRVDCWSTLYDAAFTEKTALVQLDGDDDNPDPIEATVPHYLADKLDDGDRGGPGETVVVEYDEDEDEWIITDVRGLASASGAGVKFCDTDTYTLAAAGTQTIKLSHTPTDGSLHVYWHPDGKGGIHLLPSEWTLDGSTLTVPDPGYFATNDEIDPQYAYKDGAITPPIVTLFGWGSSGWKYLAPAEPDTIDRSAVNFDDSTWATAAGGFANDTVHAPAWPVGSTAWALGTVLWLRRSIDNIQSCSVAVRIDGYYDLYWNGTKIVTDAGDAEKPYIEVPTNLIAAHNVLAVRATDNPEIHQYIDLTAEGTPK